MHAISGGGLGMLVILQRWAQDMEQMMSLLSRVDSQYARALIESQFPSHQLSQYA
jgi:hypothetical protein